MDRPEFRPVFAFTGVKIPFICRKVAAESLFNICCKSAKMFSGWI
jgi:hypothetical protein